MLPTTEARTKSRSSDRAKGPEPLLLSPTLIPRKRQYAPKLLLSGETWSPIRLTSSATAMEKLCCWTSAFASDRVPWFLG